MDRKPSRRTLLIGGGVAVAGLAAVAGVGAGVIPGKDAIKIAVGDELGTVNAPTTTPGPIVRGTFHSPARPGVAENYAIAYPPTGKKEGMPVAIYLHGRGDNCMGPFEAIGMQHYLAQAVDEGTTPFAIATLDGEQGFWINRASGRWADLVVDYVPVLREHGLDTSRLALTGYSMGGYGAILLAARQLRGKVTGVFSQSACMWDKYSEAEVGAFDSPAQFAANDPWNASIMDGLGSLPLYLTCGTQDPFCPYNQRWVAAKKPTPQSYFSLGAHLPNYWRSVAGRQVRWLGEHL